MKLLFIGDIIGKLGRKTIRQILPGLKKEFAIDLTVANGENLAHGSGITLKTYDEATMAGIEVLTSGNHIWEKREFLKEIDRCCPYLVRPANYPAGVPGKDHVIIEKGGVKIGFFCLVGRVFMKALDCPFKTAELMVAKMRKETNLILVDIHAEASSEKMAMAVFLGGKVSAVLGTHTHVQTADERIYPGGTAYLTDVGMVGAYDSIIGVQKDPILERYLTQLPTQYDPEEKGPALFNAVVLTIDNKSGKTEKIERIYRVIEP
ncbi:metallophosphoesterase [candidate division WOR-1 bacterium RIFOXYA12_FULL_43_27]|uniref:Metallophosphoesterase n=1 Tax=candidate division WOR-1 bacterium RIFOXYC2_FULL_46_14 TaxID=1802587 RepID=A0A1F4U4Q6_UNCSA|nr:MAG: metallophosphoesterase [candidate division WOR-1 bacterium RIFOXYA12_FULL_43_27]OGC20822.1 MAG: metallophosphoesterase [candidate division WOR-1 bacterium RIFOXYB2_FULL_46_45]OGC31441.1 MAG: metallophosphoesterase [candidate division WOR-1 bacterium RIFOXYA2_FULL_46_56]OGC39847.1 MAG: metallophosphoesterase [candidate division WOR-1 bacterium RIFOXYC2_FULL_46_14]